MTLNIPQPLPKGQKDSIRLSAAQRIFRILLAGIAILITGAAVNYATASRTLMSVGHAGLSGTQSLLEEMASGNNLQSIAFVGTSQFLHGIHPSEMEISLAGAGCEADVYVFAFPSLSIAEERVLLRELLERDVPELIVLPASVSTINPRTNPYATPLRTLSEVIQFDVLRSGRSRSGQIRIFRKRMRGFLLGMLGYRRLGFIWSGHYEARERGPRGYLPFPDGHAPKTEQVSRHLRERDLLVEQSETLNQSDIDHAVIDRIERRVGAADGVEQILFVGMPEAFRAVDENLIAPEITRVTDRVSTLGLNDVRLVPEIADVAFWQDESHISNIGAAQFANRAAPYICSLIRPGH